MYKSHSIWDEEQERQEKYANTPADREGGIEEYHHQGDYASRDSDQSDVYNAGKAEEGKKKEEEKTGIEKEVTDQEKKYEKREEATEEDIKRKAASEVREGGKKEDKEENKKKKEHKSIEDAINKAMKEEKEVIYIDD